MISMGNSCQYEHHEQKCYTNMNSSLGPKQVFLDRGPWRLDDGGHSHANPIKPWQTKFYVFNQGILDSTEQC